MIDPGRTTRDWFAGMALPGIIAEYGAAKADDVANAAYDIADAMMEERARTPELSRDRLDRRKDKAVTPPAPEPAIPGRMTL